MSMNLAQYYVGDGLVEKKRLGLGDKGWKWKMAKKAEKAFEFAINRCILCVKVRLIGI